MESSRVEWIRVEWTEEEWSGAERSGVLLLERKFPKIFVLFFICMSRNKPNTFLDNKCGLLTSNPDRLEYVYF